MLNIIKIGGKIVENEALLQALLESFHQLDGPKILVHGGGKKATELAQKLDVEVKVLDGRRLTDAATLEIAVMVYAGWFNKKIVSRLQALGCNAIGLTGADLNAIQSHKRLVKTVDYGLVGDIDTINVPAIKNLLSQAIVPVFCAITHDQKGQLLNTNADTIAASLAASLAAYYETQLFLCFEKKGVLSNLNDENSIILKLNPTTYKAYQQQGIISAGMLPKLDNAFFALKHGTKKAFICDAHAIISKHFEQSTLVENI